MVDFKEASFIHGKLIRISKGKIVLEVIDEESGDPAHATMKLGEGVSVELDHLGEDVKVVIVDGRVARITPVNPTTGTGPNRVSV